MDGRWLDELARTGEANKSRDQGRYHRLPVPNSQETLETLSLEHGLSAISLGAREKASKLAIYFWSPPPSRS